MHNAHKICLSLRDDGSVIGKMVLDTGSVQSMTTTMDGGRVVPIPLHLQPLI